jgi:F-type H+-transporting ATPase subunit epsilon
MAATLKLEIVTPTAKIFSDAVNGVVVPGAEGELGILPMHIPLLTELKPGVLKITKASGGEEFLAVGEGFVEVTQESVTILTDMALADTEIDEQKAQEAMERAQARMKEPNLSNEEVATVEATIEKSLAQLHLKQRRRS